MCSELLLVLNGTGYRFTQMQLYCTKHVYTKLVQIMSRNLHMYAILNSTIYPTLIYILPLRD